MIRVLLNFSCRNCIGTVGTAVETVVETVGNHSRNRGLYGLGGASGHRENNYTVSILIPNGFYNGFYSGSYSSYTVSRREVQEDANRRKSQ